MVINHRKVAAQTTRSWLQSFNSSNVIKLENWGRYVSAARSAGMVVSTTAVSVVEGKHGRIALMPSLKSFLTSLAVHTDLPEGDIIAIADRLYCPRRYKGRKLMSFVDRVPGGSKTVSREALIKALRIFFDLQTVQKILNKKEFRATDIGHIEGTKMVKEENGLAGLYLSSISGYVEELQNPTDLRFIYVGGWSDGRPFAAFP